MICISTKCSAICIYVLYCSGGRLLFEKRLFVGLIKFIPLKTVFFNKMHIVLLCHPVILEKRLFVDLIKFIVWKIHIFQQTTHYITLSSRYFLKNDYLLVIVHFFMKLVLSLVTLSRIISPTRTSSLSASSTSPLKSFMRVLLPHNL